MTTFLNIIPFLSSSTDSLKILGQAIQPLISAQDEVDKFWLIDDFWNMLRHVGVSPMFSDLLSFLAACGVLAALVWFINKVVVRLFLWIIRVAAARTVTDLDDILVKRKFFNRLFQLLPLSVILATVEDIFSGFSSEWVTAITIVTEALIIFVSLRTVYSLLDSWNDVFNAKQTEHRRSIKGYIQVVKIVLGIIAAILVVATLLQKDPSSLFIGLGTAAALIMLVFKDTILGFVASVQLSAQDMARIGDWISMPSKNADGIVMDMNVNSLKVQNWDNTLTLIPIYSMVSESFTNWRSMEKSSGRRFVINLRINIDTIKFVDPTFGDTLAQSAVLAPFIDEIKALATKSSPEATLTNLALFRANLEIFMRNHPRVNLEMPLFVRYNRDFSDAGVGIEIYAFSLDKDSVEFDAVQRSVLEYLIATTPLFELTIFQRPGSSGSRTANSQIES